MTKTYNLSLRNANGEFFYGCTYDAGDLAGAIKIAEAKVADSLAARFIEVTERETGAKASWANTPTTKETPCSA